VATAAAPTRRPLAAPTSSIAAPTATRAICRTLSVSSSRPVCRSASMLLPPLRYAVSEFKSWSSADVACQASVTCPDQKSQCPSGTTCCELASGGYGCCPYPQATCCTDKQHCCPNGYTCDLQDSECVQQQTRVPFRKHAVAAPEVCCFRIPSTAILSHVALQASVTCPDQSSHCPSGTTCCELASGGYGCCPYPQATCCADKQHCCPSTLSLSLSLCSLLTW
jgi:hypothetical protein